MTKGNILRRNRLRRGLTIEEVAAEIGLHPTTVYRHEIGRGPSGKRNWEPPIRIIRKWAEYYDLKPATVRRALKGKQR